MRRSILAGSVSAVSAAVLVVFVACGGDEGRGATSVDDSGLDATLLGDVTPPSPDAEPPPGDVCGIKSGLRPGAQWPLRGGCTTRAGVATVPGPQSASVSFSLPLAGGASSPAISEVSLVWVGTTDGNIVAVGPAGDIRWALHTSAPVHASPAIDADGNAIVGGEDGVLYALAPTNGDAIADAGPDAGELSYPPPKVVFSISVGPMISSPVIGADGTIYVGTTAGKLVAVPKNGSTTKWTVTTNDTLGSSPALGQDGAIYTGSSDGKLYAFTPDGAPKWELGLGASIESSPAVGGDGTVYVGSSDGKLHAVGSDGKARWSSATVGAITGAPAVRAGVVYTGSKDKKLHAFSTVDGAERWAYETQGAVGTPIIASDGTVYVGSEDTRVYAITPKGSLLFAAGARGKVTSAPAIGIGQGLYVMTDKALVVIGP